MSYNNAYLIFFRSNTIKDKNTNKIKTKYQDKVAICIGL